ncbi:MAG: FAD-dependent oxidoreductase [Chloroflexi bacterium]|nr:FAD-dependent oxidoreductase [Chloroflexota bacterium]
MTDRIVVVGSGFAALEIALTLRKQNQGIPVTVVTGETEIVYRPWLIRVPAGGLHPPVIPLARLLTEAGADVVSGRVMAVDLERRHVRLDTGAQIEYDQLVVASGAVADRERVPGAREHAVFPCDLPDAAEFAMRVSAGATRVAVVFGWERPGPGLEYAAWIAARRPGVRVTAIDGDDTMGRRFGGKAAAWVRAVLEKRGAQLVTEGTVERISDGTVELQGSAFEADLIAIVAPLRGSTEWLPKALLDQRGMLRVDNAMAAGAGVFGIGDVVAVPDGYRLPPALRSIQATAAGIARNVTGALRGAVPQAVLRLGQPDMMGPDLAGVALLVRDQRLVLRGRLPLLIRSVGERRYLRSRSAQIA